MSLTTMITKSPSTTLFFRSASQTSLPSSTSSTNKSLTPIQTSGYTVLGVFIIIITFGAIWLLGQAASPRPCRRRWRKTQSDSPIKSSGGVGDGDGHDINVDDGIGNGMAGDREKDDSVLSGTQLGFGPPTGGD